jgi:hypothetical protein
MKHLSNEAIVDAAEGATTFAAHLSSCEACRARVDELRAVLQTAGAVRVPEPSPLFWGHLSERVRAAVAAEPLPKPAAFRFNWAWTASIAGALAIIVIGVTVTLRTAQPIHPAPATVQSVSVDPPSLTAGLTDDPEWQLMGELASEIDWEDATEAGLAPRPGSAEMALSEMSQDEQQQVVELLQLELRKVRSL